MREQISLVKDFKFGCFGGRLVKMGKIIKLVSKKCNKKVKMEDIVRRKISNLPDIDYCY